VRSPATLAFALVFCLMGLVKVLLAPSPPQQILTDLLYRG
jgi:uncharacterized protein YjeT (DUF2065 family)